MRWTRSAARHLRAVGASHNIPRMKPSAELDAMSLAVIRDRARPCHGTEIGRELEFRMQSRVAAASLYRALHRLEDAGYLTAHWEADRSPQTHRGPRRRYYEITRTGLVMLTEYVGQFSRRAGILGLKPRSAQ